MVMLLLVMMRKVMSKGNKIIGRDRDRDRDREVAR
jgi:hypothetical protein